MLFRFIIFGILGLVAALIVDAAKKSIASRRVEWQAQTSLVLFPIFGLIAIFYPIVAIRVSSLPWYGRGAVYTLAFFVVQYIIGFALSKLNRCPWSCEGKGSLGGLIQLADAPVWFAAGLGVEHIYPWVKATAVALG